MGREKLVDFIRSYLSQMTNIPAAEFGVDEPLEHYGLDSLAAVGLSGELSELLNVDLNPEMAYEYPTISAIVDYVMGVITPSTHANA